VEFTKRPLRRGWIEMGHSIPGGPSGSLATNKVRAVLVNGDERLVGRGSGLQQSALGSDGVILSRRCESRANHWEMGRRKKLRCFGVPFR
jgi:hypothetical protein